MATFKQERAIQLMAVNGRNATKAMLEAGYSPQTAVTPHKLTKSVGFNELLEKYLPERHLLSKHRGFLDSKRVIKTYQRGDLKEVTEETDPNAVRALDMAYKLKGKYKNGETTNVLVINVSNQAAARYRVDTQNDVVDTPVDTESGSVDT